MTDDRTQSFDEKELSERVAILQKLRMHLLRQKEKFEKYLLVLEQEEKAIEQGDVEKLDFQVRMEEAIIGEIYALKKVIDPLDDMYRAAYPLADEKEIPRLKISLEQLQTQIAKHSERNRNLLKEKMSILRNEITTLRKPARKKSPYGDVEAPRLIDITT